MGQGGVPGLVIWCLAWAHVVSEFVGILLQAAVLPVPQEPPVS